VSQSLVSIEGLSWHCDGRQILDNISFQIEEGAFVGLIGPNGAGKSSLMRCCYRMNRPSTGSVSIHGRDIWQHSLKDNARQVAVILQEHHDHLGLSVNDVVMQGLAPHKKIFEWDTPEDHHFVDSVMADMDLENFRDSLFSHLSGGEKQRVMLARAIVQRPSLLVMDEPTNHLDVHYQIDLLNKVKRLGVTVLASFHDLNLASAYCDQIIVLKDGSLHAHGSVSKILTTKLINEVFSASVTVDEHPSSGVPRVTYEY
jgi:iron complex transport system ATP-binding protein